MTGSTLRGLERSPGVSQEFSFVLTSMSSHSIALLLNVLQFMPHLQYTSRERIDVLNKIFADRNFLLMSLPLPTGVVESLPSFSSSNVTDQDPQ